MFARLRYWWHQVTGRGHRGLFLFYDGRRWRSVDGLATLRAFLEVEGFDWDETPRMLATVGIKSQLQAIESIASAVREAFQLESFENGGLSETNCVDLLAAFQDFAGHVKKNGSLYPTSPDSIPESTGFESPISEKPPLDSGSIVTGPLPAPPM